MAEHIETRAGCNSDIEGILDLQSRNLYVNLSPSERENGFVTTPFTSVQLATFHSNDGIFVAESTHGVVAYALAGTWEYFSQWPIFPYMVSRFQQLCLADGFITP